MQSAFRTRLLDCMARGDLTTADCAMWFNRPYPTVRSWLELGHVPRKGAAGRLVEQRLILLERAITSSTGFPVPEISAHKRPQYITQIRNELERASVPESRAP